MKYVIASMIVLMAIVGFASAWSETNTLQYQYTKQMSMEAGINTTAFIGANSGAQFSEPNSPYGTQSADIKNTLTGLTATLVPVNGATPDTHNMLTQGGSATVFAQSPNPEAPSDVMQSATATAFQNMALSGAFTDAAATFSNSADATVGNISVHTAFEHLDSGPAAVEVEAEPATDEATLLGPHAGTTITELNMGQSATVDMEKLQAVNAIPTLSGQSQLWGGFSGAYTLVPGNNPAVDVDIQGVEQNFWMTDPIKGK